MAQLATASSWVKKSKYDSSWGFDRPDSSLKKIVIDLRPKRSPAKYNPPLVTAGMSMSAVFNERQKKKTEEQKANPEKFKKENQPPALRERGLHPFGSDMGSNRYFGGPIISLDTFKWRETCYTRACGDVIGAKEFGITLPSNMSNVIKSVAVMSNGGMAQTAIWVGPRLLLSTLHFRSWIHGQPIHDECELVRREGGTFDVENEICSQVLSELSPKVQLIEFSANHDIGLFKLQDQYPSRTEYLDPKWLMESDEVCEEKLGDGRKIACVGYNSKISAEDAKEVLKQAEFQIKRIPQHMIEVDQMDLDKVTKPSMKSFAPGTLDKAELRDDIQCFGVSASLWKGSNGGPCVLLAGVEAGTVIGLVRGYEVISDPYNIVNGFPNGLKDVIKSFYDAPSIK